MKDRSITAVIISDKDNFENFSGYKSLFWASKARGFFLVVRSDSEETHVIASASEARAFLQSLALPAGLVHLPYSGFTDAATAKIASVLGDGTVGRVGLDYGFECFGLGMIIHVEPKYELDLGVFQTEEVAVITEDGARGPAGNPLTLGHSLKLWDAPEGQSPSGASSFGLSRLCRTGGRR